MTQTELITEQHSLLNWECGHENEQALGGQIWVLFCIFFFVFFPCDCINQNKSYASAKNNFGSTEFNCNLYKASVNRDFFSSIFVISLQIVFTSAINQVL